MKVIAFNGSPRKKGNTSMLVNYVFEELEKEGIETEMVNLTGEKLRGCTACMKCFETQDRKCIFDDDPVNGWIAKMDEADGIILASPTYFSDVTTEMKALIDRAGFVSKANGDLLARKTGAAVVAVRRAGSIHVYDTLNHFFGISQMVVPGSSYWNMGLGLAEGDVAGDEEGIQTMRNLGKNMAWLMKKLYG
ncbi:MAG: multimeric flavodoxin WrbA [Methanolobus sp. T82-4]|nr:MAG: multimeric flavodoxin WrbA [Methanolobus sp. T82-4]